MSVKELKELLEEIPDHIEVTVLIDGAASERRETWMARYDEEDEEFVINC
jgi:hypothetical protein